MAVGLTGFAGTAPRASATQTEEAYTGSQCIEIGPTNAGEWWPDDSRKVAQFNPELGGFLRAETTATFHAQVDATFENSGEEAIEFYALSDPSVHFLVSGDDSLPLLSLEIKESILLAPQGDGRWLGEGQMTKAANHDAALWVGEGNGLFTEVSGLGV